MKKREAELQFQVDRWLGYPATIGVDHGKFVERCPDPRFRVWR
jgi:hypothetical protein